MSGGKETPRQKMIGMMYLVLTALLALNVSKEILDAFVVVNDGLTNTIDNYRVRNASLYATLNSQEKLDPGRAKKWNDAAKKVKTWADELDFAISEIKSEIIQLEDEVSKEVADTIKLRNVANKDKYDNATRIMCGVDPSGSNGKARELKDKIIAYKANLKSILPANVAERLELGLNTEDPPRKGTGVETWETNKFYHLPLAAQVTVLSQLQTEVRNAEGAVLNELFNQIGSNTIKVDKLAAKLIPSSSFVTIGDEFTAEIFVAAFNSTLTPKVVVNGRELTEVTENGSVLYKTNPSSEGEQKLKAQVYFKNAEGKDEISDVEYTYFAAKPIATVSPTKMNVFYIGVDNPVSISVPGVAPGSVEATITGGATISKSGAEYIVKATKQGKCEIAVSAKNATGKGSLNMGKYEFRLKRIPDPTPMVLGKKSGETMAASELKSAGGIVAVLENFDFQANFTIQSYEFGANIGGMYVPVQVQGNKFTPEVINQLNKVKPGARVFFGDIIAKGPDGTTRTLSASYKIK
jgi:gliding motility-associated protein GldM